MIAGPGRDWIAWFATARWNAGVNEAYTARSICFGSFVRKVLLFARKASEGRHAECGGSGCPAHLKQPSQSGKHEACLRHMGRLLSDSAVKEPRSPAFITRESGRSS